MRLLIIPVMLLCLLNASPAQTRKRAHHQEKPEQSERLAGCLPEDLKLADIIETRTVNSQAKPITVAARLAELKASCQNGKLFAAGKEVYFYHLVGCWGNPPADYQEIMQQQTEELKRLKESYTVVTISCNPLNRAID